MYGLTEMGVLDNTDTARLRQLAYEAVRAELRNVPVTQTDISKIAEAWVTKARQVWPAASAGTGYTDAAIRQDAGFRSMIGGFLSARGVAVQPFGVTPQAQAPAKPDFLSTIPTWGWVAAGLALVALVMFRPKK